MEPTKISSSQGASSTQAVRPRNTASTAAGHAGNVGEAVAPGAGGFLALLAALGDAAAAGADLLDTPAGAADAPADGTLPNGAADASVLAAWQGLLVPAAAAGQDAAAGRAAPGSAAGGVTGIGSAAGLPGAQGLSGPGGAAAAGLAAGAEANLGMVAETAMLDGAPDRKDGIALTGGAAHGRPSFRWQGPQGGKQDMPDTAAGRLQAAGGAATAAQGLQGPLLSALHAAAESAAAAGVAAGPQDRAGGRAAEPAAGTALAAPLQEGLAATLGAAGGGDSAAGGHHRGGDRAEGGAWLDAAAAGPAPAEPGSVDGASSFADPSQLGAEDQVAEQVAYWVNQKTQNAELTLNSDGQPVEVSVTLSGNEAHVSFRSDQAHTREVLDRSMAQLSELLRGEGLVLSGMSVGTSAGYRDNAGGQAGGQDARDGARQARVAASAPAGTAPLSRGGAPDRAVDIFV